RMGALGRLRDAVVAGDSRVGTRGDRVSEDVTHGTRSIVPNSRASQYGAASPLLQPHAGGAQAWNHTSSDVITEPLPPTRPMSKPRWWSNAESPNVAGVTAISITNVDVPSLAPLVTPGTVTAPLPIRNACSRFAWSTTICTASASYVAV